MNLVLRRDDLDDHLLAVLDLDEEQITVDGAVLAIRGVEEDVRLHLRRDRVLVQPRPDEIGIERTDLFDFDMTTFRRGVSLSPGNEQRLYWGCEMAETEGSRNLMGACHPAIEAMIDRMLNSDSQDHYRAAVQAMDRVLMSERYVIPIWHSPVSRIAHVRELHYPDRLPIYGDWLGFQPDVWWYEETD